MANDTRERMLDAAARIMRREGLAKTTTRSIAREAECSEALLYKYFPDKQELFLRVLQERVPRITSPDALVGHGSVRENLELLTQQVLAFYAESFPIAASIFGDRALLSAHREGLRAKGAGPEGIRDLVAGYLGAEQAAGRIMPAVDADAVARLLVGAALHEAFLANYGGVDVVDAAALAQRLVRAALPEGDDSER